jgi:hypothetical protein
MGGGGGGGGGGTSTQVVDLPEWAKPTAQKSLGLTEATLFTKDQDPNSKTYGDLTGFQPFKSFGGVKDASGRQVGFDPSKVVAGQGALQQRAYEGVGNLQTASQLGLASGLMGAAAMGALNTSYKPSNISASSVGSSGYNAADMQAAQTGYNPQLQAFQMGPAERLSAQNFGNQSAQDYMSPYMQQVVDAQQREARRASEITRNQQQAQAVGQGAFGGSRQAIVEAERQRNLGTQLGDIQSQGLQSAFSQAQQQFNADQARQMAAQQANQQAGLTVGQQNLASQMGTQQLGTQTGLQTALANLTAAQQAEVNNQAAKNQAMGMSAQQALQAAIANQSASLQAQQISEQSRQFGAGLGLQGLQAAMTGAGQLGQLGNLQFGQQKDIYGLQNQFGGQEQAQRQSLINAESQNFAAQQRYPYQQLEFMSNILRGTPMGTTQSLYQAPPSAASQLIGAGTSLYGAHLMGGGGRKEGGVIRSYAKGGAVKKKSAGLAELALSKI